MQIDEHGFIAGTNADSSNPADFIVSSQTIANAPVGGSTDEKGFLLKHYQFESFLMTETGWKLKVEFVKKEEDCWVNVEDPYIKLDQMIDVHANIRTITRLFGLPNVGDYIHGGDDLSKVVERTFDVDDKIVTITLT